MLARPSPRDSLIARKDADQFPKQESYFVWSVLPDLTEPRGSAFQSKVGPLLGGVQGVAELRGEFPPDLTSVELPTR